MIKRMKLRLIRRRVERRIFAAIQPDDTYEIEARTAREAADLSRYFGIPNVLVGDSVGGKIELT